MISALRDAGIGVECGYPWLVVIAVRLLHGQNSVVLGPSM
jgi:hypothetical protein